MNSVSDKSGEKTVPMKKVVILGIGNILLKDEGIGIHLINALQDSLSPPNINLEVIDGGTSPDVFYQLGEMDKLIIIDAARGGGDPGTVYQFRPSEAILEDEEYLSLHQMSILESLKIMECIGEGPKDTVIIGVEPKEVAWGLELSPELEHKIPQFVKLVMEETRKC